VSDGDELDREQVDRFLSGLRSRSGFDFRAYAPRSIGRRLRHLMIQDGVADLEELGARVLRDDTSAARFAERMCVKVTTMFRDPAFFQALRQRVLPALRQLPFLRIWLAGCATGEEVYSTAIVLREEGLSRRSRLYATDVDESALDRAARGVYPMDVMREYTQNYQRAGGTAAFSDYYRVSAGAAALDPALRCDVVFSRHNLATDASFNEFHLVLCRNVLIYFEPRLQERAHQLFWTSLAPEGVLALGEREIVPPQLARRYDELDAAHKIYRRRAAAEPP
jgi:chemotaxis protein methyltransferase CheR